MISAKNVGYFIAGSFIGGLGAIFLVRRHFQKLSEEKIEKFVADFNQKMGIFDENEVKGEENESKAVAEYLKYMGANEGVLYNNYYATYRENEEKKIDPAERIGPSEDDEDEEEIDSDILADYEDEYLDHLRDSNGCLSPEEEQNAENIAITNELNSGRKPKLITSDSYDNEYHHFDKAELEYYTIDDVLIDARSEDEIHDPERIVGDCMDRFGFRENDDETVIFVRNFNHGTDYEITKIFGEFYGE